MDIPEQCSTHNPRLELGLHTPRILIPSPIFPHYRSSHKPRFIRTGQAYVLDTFTEAAMLATHIAIPNFLKLAKFFN
jgi:hypothetical protein